jgi:hypothetical protein
VASRREEQVRRAEEAYGRKQQLERARAGEETHAILLREFACSIAAEVDATATTRARSGPWTSAGLLATLRSTLRPRSPRTRSCRSCCAPRWTSRSGGSRDRRPAAHPILERILFRLGEERAKDNDAYVAASKRLMRGPGE